MTRLRLVRLVTGLRISRRFFNQGEAIPKSIAPYTRDFSRVLSKLQAIARISDWFITLFARVVIGRRNYFGFVFFDSHLKNAFKCFIGSYVYVT